MLRTIVVGAILGVAIVLAALVYREASYGAGPTEIGAAPPAGAVDVAFVANAVGGTVSVIDLEAARVVGALNVIPDGARPSPFRDIFQYVAQPIVEREGGKNYAQDTDVSPDGRVLYVSRGFLGDVAAFDLATGEVLWRTPIKGLRADHMDISPDGARLLVAAMIYSDDRVEVLDARTGRKLGGFTAGAWPHDVHVTPDNARIYAASLGDMQAPLEERGADENAYSVTVVDAETLKTLKTIAFDAGVRPFAITKAEDTLFAQLSNTHAVVRRNLATDTQTHRIDLPVAEGVTEDDWDFEAPHHGLALTPDEKTLCIAGRASDYAALLSADDLSLTTTIKVGDAPSWASVTPDGRLCVLANNRSDDVSLISIEDAAEIARLPTGRGPKHITIGKVGRSTLEAIAAVE